MNLPYSSAYQEDIQNIPTNKELIKNREIYFGYLIDGMGAEFLEDGIRAEYLPNGNILIQIFVTDVPAVVKNMEFFEQRFKTYAINQTEISISGKHHIPEKLRTRISLKKEKHKPQIAKPVVGFHITFTPTGEWEKVIIKEDAFIVKSQIQDNENRSKYRKQTEETIMKFGYILKEQEDVKRYIENLLKQSISNKYNTIQKIKRKQTKDIQHIAPYFKAIMTKSIGTVSHIMFKKQIDYIYNRCKQTKQEINWVIEGEKHSELQFFEDITLNPTKEIPYGRFTSPGAKYIDYLNLKQIKKHLLGKTIINPKLHQTML